MGRSPCCDKLGLKKGPWTLEEDEKLLAYIDQHGHGNWRAVPVKAGLQRCGKSCRLRWTNYLRPDIKRGKFSLKEEQTIIQLHALLGNRWSAIATHLPKRTDNEIKNYWNTHLKKRLIQMGIDPVTHKPKNNALLSTGNGAQLIKNVATSLNHMAQWESARLEAEARLVRQSKLHSDPLPLTTHHPPRQMNNLNYNHNINNGNNSTSIVPKFLDVLKAWHCVWPSTTTTTTTIDTLGGGLWLRVKSPTSTLSFWENEFISHNDNNNQVDHYWLVKEQGEQQRKRGFIHNQSHYQNNHDHGTTMMMENSMCASSGLNDHIVEATDNDDDQDDDDEDGDNDHSNQSFKEGFTELLLGAAYKTTNTYGEKSQAEDKENGAETDNTNNDDRINGSSSGSDYFEDKENYWDSILNLVNSSASDSPMF